MDEIVLELRHGRPFCNISVRHPDHRIFRWCNSSIDYLEIEVGNDHDGDSVAKDIVQFAEENSSSVLYESTDQGTLSFMLRCICSPDNSTMRLAEASGCMWKAPVTYVDGKEALTVYSPSADNFRQFYHELVKFAKVNIEKKVPLLPSVIKDTFTISLSELFGSLTDKQITHLLDAINSGYFDVPRHVSLEKIASKAGIAESTLQEHLSRSEMKLMEALYPYLLMYAKSRTIE